MKGLHAAVVVAALLPGAATASTYNLLLERDVDVGGADLFLISFPTLDDFVNSTNFTQFNTQIPVDPAFSVGGFTYDGTYQLILERDVDVGGTDLFLISFPTLDDLIASTGFTQFNTQIPLDPAFSVGGFAYDGFPSSEPPPPPIPLPATSLLLLGGIGALMAGRRRT
jgi:hypothetical protein